MFRKDRKLRDNERELVKLFAELDKKYGRPIIVVEGKRDERILRDLGVQSPIIRTQGAISRHELIEKIAYASSEKPVLILTDFDQEGVEICNLLVKSLETRGVRILRRLRLKIRKLMATLRCIEELVFLLKQKDSPIPGSPDTVPTRLIERPALDIIQTVETSNDLQKIILNYLAFLKQEYISYQEQEKSLLYKGLRKILELLVFDQHQYSSDVTKQILDKNIYNYILPEDVYYLEGWEVIIDELRNFDIEKHVFLENIVPERFLDSEGWYGIRIMRALGYEIIERG